MNRIIICLFATFLFVGHGFSQVKSKKRGLAYGYHSEADMAAISKGLSWWYNWSSKPENSVVNVFGSYGMDFVPMAWNGSFNETELRNYYKAHPEAKYLLGFNEPNFTSQANMTPKQAAAIWPRLEAIAADYNLEIIGPAVNYCDKCIAVDGDTIWSPIEYLDLFFEACPDCKVDYIGVHNYMCYSGALSSYIDGFKKYGKKIWLTEFACWDQASIDVEMQKSYLMGAIDLLEADTMIFRYSWFTGNRSGAFPHMDIFKKESGQLTELGELYVNYYPVHDTAIYYSVPARIEAEDYNSMSGISTEGTKDFDGMANVGYIDAKDWLNYHVDVAETADYYIYVRVASNSAIKMELKEGSSILAAYDIPSTGGWQNWKTLVQKVNLTKGKHILQVYAPTGGFNMNWINISDKTNTAPTINAGVDQEITLPETSVDLLAIGADSEENQLKYKWSKLSGPAEYTLSDATSAAPSLTGLKAGKYIFKVVVSDGLEAVSDQLTIVVIDPTAAIDEYRNDVKIFPNPVADFLHIQLPVSDEKVSVTISDVAGRLVYNNIFNNSVRNIEIDFKTLSQGVYRVNVLSSRCNFTKSIVK